MKRYLEYFFKREVIDETIAHSACDILSINNGSGS